MTVRIGNMTAEFANSQVAYVGIGMNVQDIASDANSALLRFNVNNATKFAVTKTGKTVINADETTNTELLNIRNNGNEVVKVTSNVAKMNTTTYIKSYSEGYATVNGSDINLDLSKASVFGTSTTNFTSITFTKPITHQSETEVYSCSLVLLEGGDIQETVWTNAGVSWSSGVSPGSMQSATILTFINVSGTSKWYGVVSGKNYA